MKAEILRGSEIQVHPPNESHEWGDQFGRHWICAVCDAVMNRMTGEVIREGSKRMKAEILRGSDLRPDICLTLEGTKVYVDYLRLEDGRIIPVFNGRKVEEEH